jgi:flagellar hook-associated protein 2
VVSVSAKTFATEGSYDMEVERLASKVTVASQNKIGAAPVAAKAVTGNSGAIEWTSVPVNASVSTGTASVDQIQWTSKLAGAYGDHVRIELVDPGAVDSKLDIQVNTEYSSDVTTIRVSLATDAGGTVTTTVDQLVSAIDLDEAASQYVSAQAVTGTSGAGVVATAGPTALADGADRQNVQIEYIMGGIGDALGIRDDLNPTLRTLTVRLAYDGSSTVQDVIDLVNRYVNGTEDDYLTGDDLATSDPASLGMLRGTLLGASGQGSVNAGFLLAEPPTDLSALAAGGSGLTRGMITTTFKTVVYDPISGLPTVTPSVNLNWHMKQIGDTGYTLRIVGQETLGSAQGLKLTLDEQTKEITVRLATNPSGAVVSTVQDIISKVRADAEISALVYVELGSDSDSNIYADYTITDLNGSTMVTETISGTLTLPTPFTASLSGSDYNAATAQLGDINELTWTSLTAGTAGNNVSIEILGAKVSGTAQSMDSEVITDASGNTQIKIYLETDAADIVQTKQSDLAAYIAADDELKALIHLATTDDGAIVVPTAETALKNGADGSNSGLDSLRDQFWLQTGDVIRFTIAKASDPSVSHEFIYRGTDLDDKTIEDIVNDINAQSKSLGMGIQAIYDESFNRFYLQAKETGYDNGFTITDNSTTGGINHLNFIAGTRTEAGKQVSDNRLGLLVDSGETKRGENAVFIFEGTRIEDHGTNSVTVNEMDITLKGVGSTTITVSADVDSIVDKVTEFVEQYNIMVTALNALLTEKRISPSKYEKYEPLSAEEKEAMSEDEIKNWETSGKSGILRSDPILERALTNARVAMSAMVQNLPGSYATLSSIGITTAAYVAGSRGAELTIDEGKLRTAILAEPEGVVQLLFKTAPKVEDLPTADSIMALSAAERAAQLTSLGLDPEMGESAYRAYVNQYNAKKRDLIYNESGLYYRMSDQIVTSIKEIVRTAGTGAASDEAILRGIDRSIMSEYVSLYGSINLLRKEQEQYDSRITTLTELLLKRETRYYNQFTHMETMLANLNEQYTALEGALEQMKGLTG